MTRHTSILISIFLLALAWGCGASQDAAMNEGAPPTAQMKQPVIEEPDLYRWSGQHLYIQNHQTGLNILDVTVAAKPRLVGRAAVVGAAGSEIYVQDRKGGQKLAMVLLKSATSHCLFAPQDLDPRGWKYGAELALVDVAQASHPRVLERYCLPGKLVASRTVDQMLYMITSGSGSSQAISVDTSDPRRARVVQQMFFAGDSREIIVNAEAIFVASKVPGSEATLVQYISINARGEMKGRDELQVLGLPQGRFHMNTEGNQFRIVTYRQSVRKSRLSIIDISKPDQLKLMGQLPGIGSGEKLYATRFDGDKAYVVTFRRTDPLWVISLRDPTNPAIVGELHVPGWSDFLFPMGQRLLAVGRADNGMQVGASLFDVSDPHNPRALHQISLGGYGSSSEANVDHRAVTILEPPGKNPVLVIPHTTMAYDGSCSLTDHLQLVEVKSSELRVRGSADQQGTIRRSLLLHGHLYSISDYELLSINIDNLDTPSVRTAVTIGTSVTRPDDPQNQYCGMYMGNDEEYGGWVMFCSVGQEVGALPPVSMVLLGLLLVVVVRRRAK